MNETSLRVLRSKEFLKDTRPMLIDGSWRAGRSEQSFEVIDPATGKPIATIDQADEHDVDAAVRAARRSFTERDWLKMTADGRSRIMFRIAELIEQRVEELAELETLSMGIPIAMSRLQVERCAEAFRYYGGWCTKIHGRSTDISQGPREILCYTRKEPIGVVGLITPWNAPLLIACWKIAPTLAAGCSLVVKPAEETPLSTLLLGELMLEAGVPAGVANIVNGPGDVTGAAMAAHPDINKISFTGSTQIGKLLLGAAAGNLKRLTLELGGKSPFIIFDDADINKATATAALAIFVNSGQVCAAGSRLYVQRRSFDRVVAGIADRARSIKLGHGLDHGTEMGPLVSQKQLRTVTSLIESGQEQGAELVTGGKRIGDTGWFVEPTILARTDHSMRVMKEEIFGPVLSAVPFDEPEDIPAIANNSDFGLASYIWTRDLSRAHKMAARMESGTVQINAALLTDYSVPQGGYKQSGWGREHGPEGIEGFMETKSVIIAL